MGHQTTRRVFLHRSIALAGAGAAVPALLRQRAKAAAPASESLEDLVPTSRPATTQVSSPHGIVVTAHAGGAEAGLTALHDGGNAVDAAVAATMALCVTLPSSVGIGGYGGSMIVYLARTGKVETINFDARAPKAYRPELYAGKPQAATYGYLAIGVPGVVAGLDLALKRYGTKSWREVSRTAIRLAEQGVRVDGALQGKLKRWAGLTDAESLRAIFPSGELPAVGDLWRQPDLARLIRRLGDDPSQFYRGDVARQIIRQIQANGGILTEEDFRDFHADVGAPLRIAYRGHDICTPPPPSGGITTLGILKTLEQFDLRQLGRWTASYFHVVMEAMRLGWQERVQYLGDPEFVSIPYERLLAEATAVRRAKQIRDGDVARRAAGVAPAGPDTVNVLTKDREGNAVSLTASHGNGFGSCVAIRGLGLFLGHGMSRFVWKGDSPNAPEPGKRAHHNMSPLLVLHDGRPTAAIGMPGGTRVVTVTAQLAVNVLDFDATAAEAVAAPRVHVETEEPALLSPGFPEPVAAELEKMGHRVTRNQVVGGPLNVALIDPVGGSVSAACSEGMAGVGGL